MSELRIENRKINAAQLGPDNPLPPLFPGRKQPQFICDQNVHQEIVDNMKVGHVSSILPYSIQDRYMRQLQPTEFKVAVLENEILRASFLLEMGGRLWSLYHKPSGRELLEVNPVIQFANLAIRNAWFSGGVEWNIGTLGHSPFTCAPLFAVRLYQQDGTPILRLYEWERFRRTPFQIDAFLPSGSPVLLLRMRITNPNDYEVPMYWWSNIAVPEKPGIRVITPTDTAYCLGFEPNRLVRISIPVHAEVDLTYSYNVTHAADIFYHIPKNNRPWIVALDCDGKGLFHVSTDQLIGQKLWVWGKGTGGKSWQKFLSPSGKGYFEIQAGLTRTQLEHLTMPAGSELSWMEAYGMIEANPQKIHGANWHTAQENVESTLEQLIPRAELNAEFEYSCEYIDQAPEELMQRGSGWGALERQRREADNEAPFCSQGLVFDDESIGKAQTPWIQLLRNGILPEPDVGHPPEGFMVEEEWCLRLEKAVNNTRDNWFSQLHLGIMYYHSGDFNSAQRSWERSLKLGENIWAMRNLAMLFWRKGKLDKAADLLAVARQKIPTLLPLTIEFGKCLIEAGRTHEWLVCVSKLPESIRLNGRIRLLEAQASLKENELQNVKRFFDDQIKVDDLREGDNSLSDLWFAYHKKRLIIEENLPSDEISTERVKEKFPVPEMFDFRMSEL